MSCANLITSRRVVVVPCRHPNEASKASEAGAQRQVKVRPDDDAFDAKQKQEQTQTQTNTVEPSVKQQRPAKSASISVKKAGRTDITVSISNSVIQAN